MLAKIWKKLLLAVCIVACLFNVTNKIVHRESLELNLKNATQGSSIFSIIKEKAVELKENVTTSINNAISDGETEQAEEQVEQGPETIDGVRQSENNDVIVQEGEDNSTVVIF